MTLDELLKALTEEIEKWGPAELQHRRAYDGDGRWDFMGYTVRDEGRKALRKVLEEAGFRQSRSFRARYMSAPGIPHVYVRLFVAPAPDQTFAAVGSLTMRKDDFATFRAVCPGIEFIEEDTSRGLDIHWTAGVIT